MKERVKFMRRYKENKGLHNIFGLLGHKNGLDNLDLVRHVIRSGKREIVPWDMIRDGRMRPDTAGYGVLRVRVLRAHDLPV